MASDLTRYESQVDSYFGNLPVSSFEVVACPFCPQNTESVHLFKKGTLEARRCQCGFVWNSNQPTQEALDRFYRSSIALDTWSEIKDSGFERDRQRKKFMPAVSFLEARPLKSVLDVGCGNGVFLELLKGAMPHVHVLGTDLSPSALRSCKRRNIPYAEWGLEKSLDQNPNTYDAVSLWGVLEHVKNPIRVLRSARLRLNPGGVLVICVPNVKSLIVRTAWSKCFTFCPQHLWYFDPESLNRALARAGLEILDFTTIEPEVLPITKAMAGLDPYADAPDWAYRDLDFRADEILIEGLGYKVIAVAQAIPPVRLAS